MAADASPLLVSVRTVAGRVGRPTGERAVASLEMTIGGPLEVLPNLARQCEQAGFDALWVAETDRTAVVQALGTSEH